MSKRTAKIVLFVLFAAILVAVWWARGRRGPVDRLQHETLTVFFTMFTVLMAALPVTLWFQGSRSVRQRSVYAALVCWPVAAAMGWGVWWWIGATDVRLVPTLVIGGVIVTMLGVLALLDHRKP